MTRRWSLAAAFLLTVVCGFLIVSFGSSTGVFAWADRGGQSSGVVQTPPDQQTTPSADITITDASIPVDYGTAGAGPTDTPRREGDGGEHGEGDAREGGGDHDDGGDRD